jgi:hypothetical protein
MSLDEITRELLAPDVTEHDNLDASSAKIFFAVERATVLSPITTHEMP